jgi:hypothetical protein
MVALFLLVPVAILAGLGALVYFLARGSRADDAFTSRNLLRAYLRVAYMVSLLVFLIGAVNVFTAGFAAAFGHDFSYQAPYLTSAPACPPPASSSQVDQNAYQQCLKSRNSSPPQEPPDTKSQDDLIRGLSLAVTGIVLGAGHRLGQRAIETPAERRDSGLARMEMLVFTIAFGLATIVALPVAAYSVLRHVILGAQAAANGTTDSPGAALAAAVVFLPAWLYYLSRFVGRARGRAEVAPAPPSVPAG